MSDGTTATREQANEASSQPSIAGPSEPTTTNTMQTLSKSAAKKLAKQQAWEAGKQARRAAEKERKREKKNEKRKLVEAGLLDPDELMNSRSKRKKSEASAGPRRLFDATVVCDLAFDHLMTDRETKSMSSQVGYCYAANKATRRPVKLLYTSVGGKMQERLENAHCNHHLQWKGVQFWSESYEQLWSPSASSNNGERMSDTAQQEPWTCAKENVVYLTGDSTNVLESLEEGKTYILGGIVDRNRYKNLCLDKANAQGIAHAALPIGQHLPEMVSRKVLTVNQVFEIMIRWIETRDWGDAIKSVMPQRKIHHQTSAKSAGDEHDEAGLGTSPAKSEVFVAQEEDEEDVDDKVGHSDEQNVPEKVQESTGSKS